MNKKIRVLDVNINHCTAKQAMRLSVEYMGTAVTNVVELVTIEALMYAKDDPELKAAIEQSDLVIPGQKEILEAAEIVQKKANQELPVRTYLKLYLKYLHKNHRRVYLLGETEEEVDRLKECFAERYRGIQIAGTAKVSAGPDMDDMVVNAINGGEVDCVISVLPSPVQENFIARNRCQINARMWLGAWKLLEPVYQKPTGSSRMSAFIDRLFFKREARKDRKGKS